MSPPTVRPPRLSSEEFSAAAEYLIGCKNWRSILADALDLQPSAISRYSMGTTPVPEIVCALIEMMAMIRNNGFPLPCRFSVEARDDARAAGGQPVVVDGDDEADPGPPIFGTPGYKQALQGVADGSVSPNDWIKLIRNPGLFSNPSPAHTSNPSGSPHFES